MSSRREDSAPKVPETDDPGKSSVWALISGDLPEPGAWSHERVSDPVYPSDIRRWAIAVYWPEAPPRIFWDEEYARSTRWGGIIAPQDFNPFTWPAIRPELPASAANLPTAQRGQRSMNGGQTDTFYGPIRPGDVIRSRSRLTDWKERTTRLGPSLFLYTETEWRNQDGYLVKRRISTSIRY
jgi:acyl dehydratase